MKRLYCVLDLVASAVLPTIIVEMADAPAMRAFNDALKNQSSLLGQHPGDFNLLFLGWIEDSGQLVPETPQVIATGASWVTLNPAEPNNA